MTKEQWLEKVSYNREVLYELVRKYYPSNGRKNPPGFIPSAPGAQAACDAVCAEIAAQEKDNESPELRFLAAIRGAQMQEIYDLLVDTWFGIPEAASSWRIPGFSLSVQLIDDYLSWAGGKSN